MPYRILVNAKSDPGGPGYHQRLTGEEHSAEAVNTAPAALRSAGRLV
ncbi:MULTISPECIES: hypothetical protein [Streptomycetaceae]|nr:hypothetical protein [Streptomyces sp. CB02056]